MFGEYVEAQQLFASVVVGYLLGSVPFAHVAARLSGVDIFATGSRLGGAANVFWHIGRRTGALVFAGDVAKGAAAVVIATLLDLQGPSVLLAGAAAIVGHWKSLFTRFRGGDGMATLLGIAVTTVPTLALLGILVGGVALLLLWHSPFRTGWAIMASFIPMLGVSQYYALDRGLVMGLGVLVAMVLARSLLRRRRLRSLGSPETEVEVEVEADSDLGPAAPENR